MGGHRAGNERTADRAGDRPSERAAEPSLVATAPPVRLPQVIVWELAILLAIATYSRPAYVFAIGVTLAVLAVAMTSVRVRGLCGYQWLAVVARYAWRQRRRRTPGADVVSAVLPDLVVRAHFDPAGNHVGLASLAPSGTGGSGWSGVIRVTLPPGTETAGLVEALHGVLGRSDLGLSAGQLVAWTVPPPDAPSRSNPPTGAHRSGPQHAAEPRPTEPRAADVRSAGPSGLSGMPTPPAPWPDAQVPFALRPLDRPPRPVLPPAPPRPSPPPPRPEPSATAVASIAANPLTTMWLSVHYRPSAAPVPARARGGGVDGAVRTAAVATLTLARDLAEAGYVSTVLDDEELRREITVALGADAMSLLAAGPTPDVGPATVAVDETWNSWSAGSLTQTALAPRRAGLNHFATLLHGTTFTCWSLSLRRDEHDRLRREVTVRVGTEGTFDPAGTGLVPLVGRQEIFVRRTLPLALV